MGLTILFIFYVTAPAGIIWLCRKYPFFNKIGHILLLYILGVAVGNLPVLPENALKLQEILSSVLIPLAIPMMLYGANLKNFPVKSSTITLVCAIVAVLISITTGYLLFSKHLGEEAPKIAGMMAGSYTGGTPNMAAIQQMLNAKTETYILYNAYDMIASFIYLMFLVSVGIRAFRKFLPFTPTANSLTAEESQEVTNITKEPFSGFFKKANIVNLVKALGLTIVILAISYALTVPFGDEYFMTIIILSLTTLSIVASMFKSVRSLDSSYDAGMYLIYIFSIVVASMARLSNFNLESGLWGLAYTFWVIFVALGLHLLMAKYFRIDSDLFVVSSVATINSPPFVPMITTAMRNKEVLLPGISIGIMGYVVGTYLGFLVYKFIL